MNGRVVFNPFSPLMLILLVGIVVLFFIAVLLLPVLFIGAIGAAFAKLGFSWREALLILVLTLVGSFINIPLWTVESSRPVAFAHGTISAYGRLYRIPEISSTTTIAINVGGALIPLLISLYLLYESVLLTGGMQILVLALIGILAVTFITNRVARPIPGLGIATPFFIPPLAALFCGLLLSLFAQDFDLAAVIIAYVSGTLGTLIGADLLNLNSIADLGAPTASIGGAGTFDGVFLSGIIAALLA